MTEVKGTERMHLLPESHSNETIKPTNYFLSFHSYMS